MYFVFYLLIFTGHFSGPGRAIGVV